MDPYMIDPWILKHPGPFQVGDRVRFLWGGDQVEGTIVEDRGIVVKGGKRKYGIKFRVDDVSDEMYTERPVDAIQLVAKAEAPGDK
jgi:hypothetical protein